MRRLTDHVVEGDRAEQLEISVLDEPGVGGANHAYRITGFETASNSSAEFSDNYVTVLFQNGPIKESGVNGITQEALLAIVIDRLRGFQDGLYLTRENQMALGHCEEALMWLQKRTRSRIARGVEGMSVK